MLHLGPVDRVVTDGLSFVNLYEDMGWGMSEPWPWIWQPRAKACLLQAKVVDNGRLRITVPKLNNPRWLVVCL